MKENKNIIELAESAFRKLVTGFIKHPSDLEVNTMLINGDIVIQPRAHYADTGNIIGKSKANFTAVETILAIIGYKNKFNIRLNRLLPAVKGSAEFQAPFDSQEDWPEQQTTADLNEILALFTAQKPLVKVATEIIEGEEWTAYYIKFSPLEKLPIAPDQIARSLSKIMHAVGRERGRKVKVEAQNACKTVALGL